MEAIFPYSYFNMGKMGEHTKEMREKCVELHKSGNGCKTIATHLKMPISTIRAKEFKVTPTVANLPGRGHMFILPPKHSEVDKRGKKFPKDHCWKIAWKVASWGHQVSKTAIRQTNANKLFGRHARKIDFLKISPQT